jgi:hypothetical protein
MTLLRFLRELTTSDERVPFIPDMDYRDPPDFPEGVIVPITEQVYFAMMDMLPPRWRHHSGFMYGEGSGKLTYFWEEGQGKARKYFGLGLIEAQTQKFYELSRVRQHQ